MKLIAPVYKEPKDYLKDIQQDTLLNVSTIHDEINLGVEKFLLKPMLKKIIGLYTAKEIINQFGYRYMNFLYDSEYNGTTGAFSGEGYKGVESFSPYTYPKSRDEHRAKIAFHKVIDDLSVKVKPKEKPIEELELSYFDIEGLNLKKYKDKKGVTLIVKENARRFQYKHKVNKEKLLKAIKKKR
jgi:hypothetical protein